MTSCPSTVYVLIAFFHGQRALVVRFTDTSLRFSPPSPRLNNDDQRDRLGKERANLQTGSASRTTMENN